jgi:hypothetical protein
VVVERVWFLKQKNTITSIPIFSVLKTILFPGLDFVGAGYCFFEILKFSNQGCKLWSALTKTMHYHS